MKQLFILAVSIFLAACNAKEQSNQRDSATDTLRTPKTDARDTLTVNDSSRTSVDDTTYPIESIKSRVEWINTQYLKLKHIEFVCDEKMKVDFFYHNEEVVKISVDFGTVGDVYAKEEYYYNQGRLIFFYEFVEGGPACEGCVKKNEYKSYIQRNEVTQYFKDNKPEKCRKCSFTASSKEYKLLLASTDEQVKTILCR